MKQLFIVLVIMIPSFVNAQIYDVNFGDKYEIASPRIQSICNKPTKVEKTPTKIVENYKDVELFGLHFSYLDIEYNSYSDKFGILLEKADFGILFNNEIEAKEFADKLGDILKEKYGVFPNTLDKPDGYSIWEDYGKSPSYGGEDPLCSLSVSKTNNKYYLSLGFGPFYMPAWLKLSTSNNL